MKGTARETENIVIETEMAIITGMLVTVTTKRIIIKVSLLLLVGVGPWQVTTPTLVVGVEVADDINMTGIGNETETTIAVIEIETGTVVVEGGVRTVIDTTLPLVMSTIPKVTTLKVGGATATTEKIGKRGEVTVAIVVGVEEVVVTEGGTGDTHNQEVC